MKPSSLNPPDGQKKELFNVLLPKLEKSEWRRKAGQQGGRMEGDGLAAGPTREEGQRD